MTDVAPRAADGPCPNEPPCEHPASAHDAQAGPPGAPPWCLDCDCGGEGDDDEPCDHDHDENCLDELDELVCLHQHCMACGGCSCPGYCDDYQTYNLRPAETGGEMRPDGT